MTFTCYEPQHLASVMTIDLRNGKVENMSKAPGTYNECEGIYPDGRYANAEADRQVEKLGGSHGSQNIDVWKLHAWTARAKNLVVLLTSTTMKVTKLRIRWYLPTGVSWHSKSPIWRTKPVSATAYCCIISVSHPLKMPVFLCRFGYCLTLNNRLIRN